MVGIGKGTEKGILIRDAVSLETAGKIDTVVLDKTGTLTEGKPVVTDIVWANGDDRAEAVFLSLENFRNIRWPMPSCTILQMCRR